MVRTGSGGEEGSNSGGVNSGPDEAGHSMTVGPVAAVAGEVAPGEGVPAGERGQMVARDALALGALDASGSADVHAARHRSKGGVY